MLKILCLAISLTACSQNSAIELKKNTIGQITKSGLFKLKPSWKKTYEKYKALEKTKLIGNYEFLIVAATWCHDSEREIPILLKVLKEFAVREADINIYLCDRKKEEPKEIINANKIFFTPTIIVKKDGKEIKRFVENPNSYWERDLRRLQMKGRK
jgi:thiol-disulfide isomerase/thioredoxin